VSPVREVALGQFTDRYVIERELGRGASAIVYLARDREMGRLVAIKVLRFELIGSISTDRFIREIQLTSELSHPHIVPILASGNNDGVPFCVLPYMDEGTLRRRLVREKQLPIEDVIAIGARISRALAFAHSRNLIHRDVKPENILFTAGQPVLADFGIARALERSLTESTTSTGIVRGTPAYMSPEQASAEREIDGRTDIYSLACVLYEAAAGIAAFVGPSAQQLASQRMLHMPRPLHVYRPTVPEQLETVLNKALAVTPADRYRSAAEFADALESIDLSQSSRSAAQPSWPTAEVRRFLAARQRAMVYAALAVAVVVTGVVARFARRTASSEIPDRDARRIAVLYFKNRTPDGIPSYVADGITEDLIDELSSVRGLRLTSPTVVRRFRDQTPPIDSLVRALRVGTVVDGSLALVGNKLRINLRLTDGATGLDIGKQQVDATQAEAFSLPDRLVGELSAMLRERLGNEIALRAHRAETKSAAAWAVFQMASEIRQRATASSGNDPGKLANYQRADSLYGRAAELDPSWNLPLVKRGDVAVFIGDGDPPPTFPPPATDSVAYRHGPIAEKRRAWFNRAVEFADEVIRRDPKSAEALWLRANASLLVWTRVQNQNADSIAALAARDFHAALAVRPDFAKAWASLAELSRRQGRFEEAADEAQSAYDRDAFLESSTIVSTGFQATLRTERFDQARRWCQIGLEHWSDDVRLTECKLTIAGWTGGTAADAADAWRLLNGIEQRDSLHQLGASWNTRRYMVAAVLARAGLSDSARAVLAQIHAHDPNSRVPRKPPPFAEAYVRLLLGDRAGALAILTEWQRVAKDPNMGKHPWLKTLRGDPQFEAIVNPAR
jgi:eukaryotic-like serine/threonine-protein kinase